MVGLASAAGLVGFLSEPDPELIVFALKTLDSQIDLLWTEVVDAVPQIEALYEDESFPERELAALVAAKVYYHLQEYNESMVFALGAGKLFQLDSGGEFEETIIAKCVDTFVSLSAAQRPVAGDQQANLNTAFPTSGEGATSTSASLTSPITPFSQSALPSKSLLSRQEVPGVDASYPGGEDAGVKHAEETPLVLKRGVQGHLQTVIDRLFEQCFVQKRYRQVIGIAIEAKNLDVLRKTILRASEDEKKQNGESRRSEELMEYVLDICMGIVQERGFRNELILELLNEIPAPDYFSIAKCVVYLNEHSMASVILRQLVEKGDARSLAVAYQISFDLYDNSTQEFLQKVRQEISELVPEKDESEQEAAGGDQEEPKESDPLLDSQSRSIGDSRTKISPEARTAFKNIRDILDGVKTNQLNVEFLFRNNKADIAIMNKLRDSLEARNSIFHSAVSLSNGFMHAGTAHDKFFRDNLDWLSKAVNWSKFTATAALGVIHRGNLSQGQKLLQPYLPKERSMTNVAPGGHSGASSIYSQGGSLYAYGLIFANHGGMAVPVIRDYFKKATDEVIQHGGALGLGVAGMASGDEGLYEDLRNVLYTDSAVNGEAVGLAMGLIMLGTGNMKVLEDMIQYAHDTQHEKIVRGLAMGMALIMYGRQEAADELINGLLGDPDPALRYGGIMTIALAYCGSSSNKAVRKLLHVAVSDVNDDVRRIAVLSLGFILFRKHQSVPRMVELLSESYNPHVRYGAAMALGISCAGTGLDEAIDLLEPMLKDSTDFVRQGALISLAMVLVQQNEAMNPRVSSLRKVMMKMIGDRHEDAMAKFGCAVALGIIDAGGRNCTISLQTQTGNLNMPGIVGAAVFVQYWYWFPLTHFLSLSFAPTSVIGVDQKLEVPYFKFHSNTRPSLFDYPPEQQVKAEEAPEKVKTAVLSTTAQAKRRAQRREKQQRRESMDIDQTPTTPKVSDQVPDKMDTDETAVKTEDENKEGEKEAGEGQKKKIEREKVGYELENMSRVLPAQLKYLTFPDPRYEPVKRVRGLSHCLCSIVMDALLTSTQPTGGVVVVLDKTPEEPRETIEMTASKETREARQPAPAADVAESLQDRLQTPQRGAGRFPFGADLGPFAGAAAAAGVLTAVDEDEEGGEEAPVPNEFEYETEPEDE
ncbi:hypothetical protein ASPBRDRAFT_605661 [Aspergillus brasiliensis CBS 101740]|uniref:26S proteasome regulatory subunit RPN2 n=1 Tax=Aspergillus brasiliensis (strain CBS 101740 / IMI 381727 / IBT 21946) TaxID=767769 RepID=A0A1L9UHK3_ASPBC|nr:hypothetical protein ASPBRDRAFT_605661 [Aspergillus brasiliensis CBS 101740]